VVVRLEGTNVDLGRKMLADAVASLGLPIIASNDLNEARGGRASHRSKLMNFTAVIEREGDGFVSLCPELDIASQATMLPRRGQSARAIELFLECADVAEINQRLHGLNGGSA